MTSFVEMLRVAFPAPILSLFLCCIIVTVCLTGDIMLTKVPLQSSSGRFYNSAIVRAFIDSSTHALVGFFVWAMVENSSLLTDWSKWFNCVAAAVLAASVDLDHFLAAGSLSLKKALHLSKRPPFHNTSLVFGVTFAIIVLNKWRPKTWIFALMFLSAWLSHHIRDANHRGLWIFPFGHTSLFSTQLYIGCILVLAFCVRLSTVLLTKPSSSAPAGNIVRTV
ncbi:transmembrane protein 267 [Elysia marginata]|uniref:Transmembrane protein 267 n=1 Tax=Elysia marginata TaxID=1093978 RepID=A0AAV4JPM7_9GAST|nr:transmembrane protein 267 [Elysia marginata]